VRKWLDGTGHAKVPRAEGFYYVQDYKTNLLTQDHYISHIKKMYMHCHGLNINWSVPVVIHISTITIDASSIT